VELRDRIEAKAAATALYTPTVEMDETRVRCRMFTRRSLFEAKQ
jgi:hypothetical protein